MIDLRVMNDFPDNKKPAIFENLARRIREIDRALDTVAKTKLFRQAHRSVAHGDDPPRPAHFLDDVTAVVRFHLLLHRSHHVGRAQVHFLPRSCAAGNEIRAHDLANVTLTGPFSNGWPEAGIGLSTDDHWSTSSGPGGSLNQLGDINCERGGSGSRLCLSV